MPPDGDIAPRLTINAPYGDTSLAPLFNISDVGGLWKQARVPHADKSAWGSSYWQLSELPPRQSNKNGDTHLPGQPRANAKAVMIEMETGNSRDTSPPTPQR